MLQNISRLLSVYLGILNVKRLQYKYMPSLIEGNLIDCKFRLTYQFYTKVIQFKCIIMRLEAHTYFHVKNENFLRLLSFDSASQLIIVTYFAPVAGYLLDVLAVWRINMEFGKFNWLLTIYHAPVTRI